MKIYPKIIPVTNRTKAMFGAVIIKEENKSIDVLMEKYDFDTKAKAIKWVNKNFYRLVRAFKSNQA